MNIAETFRMIFFGPIHGLEAGRFMRKYFFCTFNLV